MMVNTNNNNNRNGFSPQHATSGNDLDKADSPQSTWSGANSGEDDVAEQDGSSSTRKRKRPMSVSCELCKQRKVKCDRAQPRCGWCTRNGHVCEYKERKKPGLRAGYGRELELRLDRLEELVNSQGRLIKTHLLNPPPPSTHDQGQSSLFLGSGEAKLQQVPQQDSANVFLQKPSHYQEQPTGMDYQQQPVATPILSQGEYFGENTSVFDSPNLNVSSVRTEFVDANLNLPPYDLLYELVDKYFKHINTWCPILHRKTILDSLFGPSALEEADRVLLHAIVATSLRFSTDPRLSPENRKRYHDSSKQRVLLYGLENQSIKALQALVILALDLTGSSNGPPGWNLLALITRSVVQLGLAVESSSNLVAPMYPSIYTLRAMVLEEPKSWIEDESRRRLFWMVYLLDRYATIATAFDFALNDKEVDRKLPCRDDLFSRNQAVETRWFRTTKRTDYPVDRPENLGSFSYYCEVLAILSRIHEFLKRPVDIGSLSDVERWQRSYRNLDEELNSWKFRLPTEYGNISRLFKSSASNKIVNCGWIMLHATFHTALIRLHSSAAYPTTRSSIFTPSYKAAQACLAAVSNISQLAQYVLNNGMLDKLGPPFAFSLWVSARLLLVHGSTMERSVSPDIGFFVSALREMGRYWEVAKRYCDLLDRVLEEYQQSEEAVGASGERATPQTVKILADMRRTAYDLEFLISRQPHPTLNISQATPARTPAPNELEYLDVFDFFNLPRLPVPPEGNHSNNGEGLNPMGSSEMVSTNNEFNITNYMIPNPESDWLFKATA